MAWSEATCPGALGRGKADAYLDPDSPRCQAIDEDQREVCHGVAAVPLDLAGPAAAAHGPGGGGGWGGRA